MNKLVKMVEDEKSTFGNRELEGETIKHSDRNL